ncbi:MAG: hypothetical protein JNM51_12520 [Bacteroidia bacterium]|nr:hypothetical protein [Bacteroidia bacterium]
MSCKKDVNPYSTKYSKAKFTVSLKCDAAFVYIDSLMNINSSGNIYSIHTVNFYISNFKMKRDDDSIFSSSQIIYIDPFLSSKNTFYLDSIPVGNYTEVMYTIGIDSNHNIDYGLTATLDNLNMAWPTAMGGGYHFLKMEGHYLDSLNINQGYAIHIGKNENLILVKNYQLLQQRNDTHEYSMIFNINEVFTNPYNYNLNIENNYTMSDSVAMLKIKNNIKDAFHVFQNK